MIGDPVEHSLSPVLHNAVFRALGLDWVYVALPVAPGELRAAIAGFRALGLMGLSVTMPHKAAVAAEMDRLSETAERLGAVNTVVRHGSELVGESTDGEGFVAALRTDEGWDPAGRTCVVLGAGGAARAVIVALAAAGAAHVLVVARRERSAQAAAALAGSVGGVASIDAVAGADLVVNATPVGMTGSSPRSFPGSGPDLPLGTASGSGLAVPLGAASGAGPDLPLGAASGVGPDPPLDVTSGSGGPALPLGAASGVGPVLPFDLDPGRLGSGQLVVDLIYAPPGTALLDAARTAGAQVANGLGTLIHQAARQSRLWTGMDPPLEVMSAAALSALSGREHPGS